MSDVVVLCYHAVSPDWPAQLSVTPERFAQQLGELVERGYRGATFTEAVTSPPHPRTLAVTFDDGMRSVLERARPVLDRLGLPATVFVPTDLVGSEGPMSWRGIEHWLGGENEGELVPLTWRELDGLRDEGWEIGSHSRTHPRLVELGDDELAAELKESRERLEAELGGRCLSLAYPFGEADDRVIRAAGEAGYRAAGGLPTSFDRASALSWPRTGVWHSDGPVSFRVKVSRPVRWLQRSSAFRLVDRPRRAFKRLLHPDRMRRAWVEDD
jgi:peptidoglycan/xylan/chitin deacetylase (PgdA/CDA1 family)